MTQVHPHIEVQLLLGSGSPPLPVAPMTSFPIILGIGDEWFSSRTTDGTPISAEWTGTISFLFPEAAMRLAKPGVDITYFVPPAHGTGRIIRILGG